MSDTTYNGWKNRETWNVSLWINNDEPMYRAAVEYMEREIYKSRNESPYEGFVNWLGLHGVDTPDGVGYWSPKLDYTELNEMMRELI